MTLSRKLAILFLPLLASGCRSPEPAERERSYDLIAELPAAEVSSEVGSLELRVPETRRHLVAGWSGVETDHRSGRDFVWSTAEQSVLELPLLRRRDLELVFDCRALTFPQTPPQILSVVLNDQEVGRLKLRPRIHSYRLRLPSEHLVTGRNHLVFRYAQTYRPADVRPGSRDRRNLAVAWYGLRFEPSGGPGPLTPQVDAERSLLFVPFGVEIDYYLLLAPYSVLRVRDWAFRGSFAGQLEVLYQEEDGSEHLLTTVRPELRPDRIPLTVAGSEDLTVEARPETTRIARLRLRALAPGKVPGDAGVVLLGPSIWARKGSPPSPPPAPAPAPVAAAPPPILIYLVDTLRADHLGCYGYERKITPQIDAFAQEAIVFENAIAQSSWTKSSVASILTGVWPVAHGANKRRHKLSTAAVTLPEVLAEAGYATAAFVTNPNVTADFGLDQGYDELTDLGKETRADEVTAAVVAWLDERRDPQRPFFLYVHTMDPHDPYEPTEEYRARFAPEVADAVAGRSAQVVDALQAGRRLVTEEILADVLALYDAEIAANDHAFGLLMAALVERNLWRDALVVVVSDHGEEFYEHGNFKHGRSLYAESLRVPLIIKLPGAGEARRVTAPVQHVDLMPTLLAYLGLPVAEHLEGRNLLAPVTPAPITSYLHLDGSARASLLSEDWKLIARRDGRAVHHFQLYRVSDDPQERDDLAAERPVRAGYLASLLRGKILATDGKLSSELATISKELEESLIALGYLEDEE